ncbi:MAG: TolC family protein, partial [Oceanobacter sp.]
FSLKAAWASFRSSRAVAVMVSQAKYPTLSASLSRSRTIQESSAANQWTGSLTAGYELDLWGRVSALADQGEWNALAAEASAHTVANTVAGEISESAFGARYQNQQLALLEQQKQRIATALDATQRRYRRGLVDASDVWQQQQALEAQLALIASAQVTLEAYFQQLAIWSGDSSWMSSDQRPAISTRLLPEIEADVPVVTLESLRQRPDVVQAWYQVQAANASVAAAVANRYPRLSLSATYQGQNESLPNLFDNWLANLAANLVMPILDAGEREATEIQNRAALDAALANYQQTLMAAAQEVLQVLLNDQNALEQSQSLATQLELARKTERYLQSGYERGASSFLQWLSAQQSVLALERQLLTAQWQRLQYRIQLYRTVSQGRFDVSTESLAAANDSNKG